MGMGGVGIISLSPYERRPHQVLPLFTKLPSISASLKLNDPMTTTG